MDNTNAHSTSAAYADASPPVQKSEQDAAGKWSRRFLKPLLIIFGVVILALGSTVAARLVLPTRPGWDLIPLKQDNVFVQNPIFWTAGRCYAQKPLVQAFAEAGKLLEKRCPGAAIAYLDASGRNGGKLLGHLSHKYGRDIDILYIGRDKANRLYPRRPHLLTVGYRLHYGENGRCGSLTFDRKANLHLMLALLEQQAAPVEKIFVEPYIRSWIIREAETNNIPGPVIARLKQALRYAGKNAARHDDHLHVRFKLPEMG
jgi:hypothetical protein